MNRQVETREKDAPSQKHELHLVGRREMRLCGVEEVIRFDESGVLLLTDSGELTVEGSNIHIGTLDTENGMLHLDGKVDAIYYTEAPDKKSSRLFGKWFR